MPTNYYKLAYDYTNNSRQNKPLRQIMRYWLRLSSL